VPFFFLFALTETPARARDGLALEPAFVHAGREFGDIVAAGLPVAFDEGGLAFVDPKEPWRGRGPPARITTT
jgi:hypothetical protein